MTKGLAKLGNIVAETLLCAQMFPRLVTQETLLQMQILRPWRKKMNQVKNILICFKDANVASATYVS